MPLVQGRHQDHREHPTQALATAARHGTLDHLDDRYSPERGKSRGERRIVMACWKCNNERNIARQAALPKAVLHEKCGRAPRSERV